MDEIEDPLDLLDDDGDGVIEVCLLEEEDDNKNGEGSSGCCLFFLTLGSSLIISILNITNILTL